MPAKKTAKKTAKTTTKATPKNTAKKTTSTKSTEQMAAKMKSSSSNEKISSSVSQTSQSKIVNGLVLVLLSVVALSAGIVVGDYVFSKTSFSSIKMPVSVPFLGGEKQSKTAKEDRIMDQNNGGTLQERPTEIQTSVTIDGVEIALPNESSSDEELMKFGQQIASLSKETDTVTIGENCELTPPVPKAAPGGSIAFTNTTDTDVNIFFLGERHNVVAGESITAQVGDEPMTTGISCAAAGMVGFLNIE